MSKVSRALEKNHPDGANAAALKCPWCGTFGNSYVYRTDSNLKHKIRRKRVCRACNKNFRTAETVEER